MSGRGLADSSGVPSSECSVSSSGASFWVVDFVIIEPYTWALCIFRMYILFMFTSHVFF